MYSRIAFSFRHEFPRHRRNCGRLRDPVDVKQRGEEHSDLDCDSQIGEHGEGKGHHPHGYVRFRQPEYGSYFPPFTHVVGHHEKNRGERGQRNETREWRSD